MWIKANIQVNWVKKLQNVHQTSKPRPDEGVTQT